jgi:tRNA threonylcarbamoyladenosine biosynthesis protein TsaE
VPSPTYTLVEPYHLARGTVYHVDLYRIAGADELHFLGWSELDDGLRIIEWPERLPGIAASSDIWLRLNYDQPGRTAELQGLSARAGEVLAALPDRLRGAPANHTE